MEPDLDELHLELGAFLDRGLRRELLELALGEDVEVVGVDLLLRDEEEATLRLGLELREARRGRPDEHRGDLGVQLHAVGLLA